MSQIFFSSNTPRADQPDRPGEGAFTTSAPGASMPAPSASSSSASDTGGPDYSALGIPALAAPLPYRGTLSLEQLVQAVGGETRRLIVQQALEGITLKGDEIKALNDKKAEEIQKQLAQLEKKEKLNPFIKALKWVGMALGVIGTGVVIAAGAITGNPLLIAGGVIGAAMLINSIASEVSDGKYSIGAGAGAIAKKCGASEKTAHWIGFGIELGIALAGAGLTIGGAFASATSQTASQAMKVMSIMAGSTSVFGGATAAGQGAVQIIAAGYDYKIAQAKAEMQDLQAILERVQTAMQTESDLLESVVQRTEELLGTVREIVRDTLAAQTTILTSTTPNMA
jgi:hypothetical protein